MEYSPKRYSYRVYYSESDKKCIARCIEIPGCTGTGKNHGEAIEDAEDTVQRYLEFSNKLGASSPKPGTETEERNDTNGKPTNSV